MIDNYLLYLRITRGNTPESCGSAVAGLRFFYKHVAEKEIPIEKKSTSSLLRLLPLTFIWVLDAFLAMGVPPCI